MRPAVATRWAEILALAVGDRAAVAAALAQWADAGDDSAAPASPRQAVNTVWTRLRGMSVDDRAELRALGASARLRG